MRLGIPMALVALVAGVLSCYRPAASAPQVTPPTGKRIYRFASDQLMREHWRKHGEEFGRNVTLDQYLAKAQVFFSLTPPQVELKHRPNGDELRYSQNANEFGVLSSAGKIRTYFRPSNGRRYWDKQ